jgi:hypothetical protein
VKDGVSDYYAGGGGIKWDFSVEQKWRVMSIPSFFVCLRLFWIVHGNFSRQRSAHELKSVPFIDKWLKIGSFDRILLLKTTSFLRRTWEGGLVFLAIILLSNIMAVLHPSWDPEGEFVQQTHASWTVPIAMTARHSKKRRTVSWNTTNEVERSNWLLARAKVMRRRRSQYLLYLYKSTVLYFPKLLRTQTSREYLLHSRDIGHCDE